MLERIICGFRHTGFLPVPNADMLFVSPILNIRDLPTPSQPLFTSLTSPPPEKTGVPTNVALRFSCLLIPLFSSLLFFSSAVPYSSCVYRLFRGCPPVFILLESRIL